MSCDRCCFASLTLVAPEAESTGPAPERFALHPIILASLRSLPHRLCLRQFLPLPLSLPLSSCSRCFSRYLPDKTQLKLPAETVAACTARCIQNVACPSIQLANGARFVKPHGCFMVLVVLRCHCRSCPGVQVPMIGYGTAYFQDGIRRPELTCHALRTALRLGYRHVDSAAPWSYAKWITC